jgi:hypothetical protein
MGEARPLYKIDHAMTDAERIRSLEARLRDERRQRKAAEDNAKKWHAMWLAARVAALPPRRTP